MKRILEWHPEHSHVYQVWPNFWLHPIRIITNEIMEPNFISDQFQQIMLYISITNWTIFLIRNIWLAYVLVFTVKFHVNDSLTTKLIRLRLWFRCCIIATNVCSDDKSEIQRTRDVRNIYNLTFQLPIQTHSSHGRLLDAWADTSIRISISINQSRCHDFQTLSRIHSRSSRPAISIYPPFGIFLRH